MVVHVYHLTIEAHWQARLANPMRLGSMRDSVYKTEKKLEK